MTTEQRLERLERENRWMRRIGAVAVAVAAAVFLIGQGKDKDLQDLVVRSVLVKDKHGALRAILDKDGLIIHDEVGLVPLVMLHGNGGLGIYDRNGRQTLAVGVGRGVAGVFLLGDKNGRASLQTAADGSPALRLLDKDGHNRAVLGVTEAMKAGVKTKTAENTLRLYDAKGKLIWKAPKD